MVFDESYQYSCLIWIRKVQSVCTTFIDWLKAITRKKTISCKEFNEFGKNNRRLNPSSYAEVRVLLISFSVLSLFLL